jgi:hypothetical protein
MELAIMDAKTRTRGDELLEIGLAIAVLVENRF